MLDLPQLAAMPMVARHCSGVVHHRFPVDAIAASGGVRPAGSPFDRCHVGWWRAVPRATTASSASSTRRIQVGFRNAMQNEKQSMEEGNGQQTGRESLTECQDGGKGETGRRKGCNKVAARIWRMMKV